jgi:hypothetical protein
MEVIKYREGTMLGGQVALARRAGRGEAGPTCQSPDRSARAARTQIDGALRYSTAEGVP